MRIAVVSDTHIGQRLSVFPRSFVERLDEFDGVIHCGDYTNMDALDFFRGLKLFYGVHGNMDDTEVKQALPETLIIELEGVKIGVIHGWGPPFGLELKVLRKISETYPNEKLDIVLFGHTHTPLDQTIKGIRVINPGALSGNIFSKKGSWGILTIENGKIDWQLISINPRD